jgi:hypothetical protein
VVSSTPEGCYTIVLLAQMSKTQNSTGKEFYLPNLKHETNSLVISVRQSVTQKKKMFFAGLL